MYRLKQPMLLCIATLLLVTFIINMRPAGAAPPASTQASSCTSGRILLSPNPGSSEDILRGVVSLSYRNVWAVGQYTDNQDNTEKTLIEHWDGKSWNVVPSPDPGPSFNFLYGVAANSPTDIWAAGTYYSRKGGRTLIEHWNGTGWTVVPSPNVGSDFNNLYAVTAVSANDVWAVGNEINAKPQQNNTLIEHWNGRRWSVISSPNPGTVESILQGVSVVSANDIWTVGNYSLTNGHNKTLIEHWNGTTWSVVSSPNVGKFSNVLNGVSAVSSNDIWAVGYNVASPGNVDLTLTEHWNGRNWKAVPSPSPSSSANYLNGVVAISKTNVWTVGYTDKAGGSLIEQWDGTHWNVIVSKNEHNAGNVLMAVSADMLTDIWVAGFIIKEHQHELIFHTLVEHYCS